MGYLVELALVLTALGALAYLVLGLLLGRRRVAGPARAAYHVFRAWWLAAAVVVLIDPVVLLLHRAGRLSLLGYRIGWAVELMAAAVAAWALLCYLVYVYRGDRRWWAPVSLYYVLLALLMLWMVAWFAPDRLVVRLGEVEAVPDGRPMWLQVSVVAGFLLPLLAGVIAYLRLVRIAPDATSRYRAALVGSSLVMWIGAHFVLQALAVTGVTWELLLAAAGLLAPALAYLAYFPPLSVRRRWHVQALGHEHVGR